MASLFWKDTGFYFNLLSAACAIVSIYYARKSIQSSKDSEKYSQLSAESEDKSANAVEKIAQITEKLFHHSSENERQNNLNSIRDFGINIYKKENKGFDIICKRISEGYQKLTKEEFEEIILDIAGRVGVSRDLQAFKRYFPTRYL